LAAGPQTLRQFLADRFARFAEAEWNFLREAVEEEGAAQDAT